MSSDVVDAVCAEVLVLDKHGRLLAEIFSGQSERTRLELFLDTCVALHNSGEIDLIKPISVESLSAFDDPTFFIGQHFYCMAIPRLQADLSVMMAAVRALVQKGGADLAANGPNGAFRDWCRADISRARQVVSRTFEGDILASEFATFGLEVSNDVETACEWVRNRSDLLSVYATVALGRMIYPEARLAHSAVDALCAAVRGRADDLLHGNALVAALQLLKSVGPAVLERVRELIAVVCEAPGPQTTYCMARELWSGDDALDNDIVERLLSSVSDVDLEAASTLRELDTALAHLLGTRHASNAIAAAGHLLDRGEIANKPVALDAFSHQLLMGDVGLCQRTLVTWLLSGSRSRCDWLATLMRGERRDPFENLDLSTFDLSQDQLMTLGRRALGYLFLYPVAAGSIIVSCLRLSDRPTAKKLTDLLFDPLLINYGGAAKSYLTDIQKTDASYKWVRKALGRERIFLKDARSVGIIKELAPSERHRQFQRLKQQDDARRIGKMTEEHSVFMQLVHRSTLLYGRRSVTYVGLPGEPRRAMDMELKEHSFSFELPRLEVLDPFGFDYNLRVLRSAK